MMKSETFAVEVKKGTVRGTVHFPADGDSNVTFPGILICQGPHTPSENAESFLDELTQTLGEADHAVARFEPRCTDLILEDYDAYQIDDELQETQAVYQWLENHKQIDHQHLKVIGYSLGALAAKLLAESGSHIDRLCLINPATPQFLIENSATANRDVVVLSLEHLPTQYLTSLSELSSLVSTSKGPKTFLIHGAADRVIPPSTSNEILRKYEMNDQDVEHILIARGDHTFSVLPARAACLDCVAEFLATKVAASVPAS